MSSLNYRGRIPYVDEEDIISYGRDDIRGLPIMVSDMVPVMQYAGSQIVWTGFYTHKDYVDMPQAQLAPAWLKPDPQPSPIIRTLLRAEAPPIPTGLSVEAVTDTTVTASWDSVSAATSYVLQWTSPSAQLFIADIPTTVNPTVTYEITGLAPDTYYVLQVASTAAKPTVPITVNPSLFPQGTSAYSEGISTFTFP